MVSLEYFYDMINESSNKRIERLSGINQALEDISNSKHWLLKGKEWRRLIKEFDMVSITINNELKALDIIISMMKEGITNDR